MDKKDIVSQRMLEKTDTNPDVDIDFDEKIEINKTKLEKVSKYRTTSNNK